MLLTRPKDYTLIVNPPADLSTALTACALAALKQQPTTIENVERTELLIQFCDFLASGGIDCRWSDRTLTLSPSDRRPFTFTKPLSNYESFAYALTLAATASGSTLALIDDMDETIQMTVLALRRMGAELEFVGGKSPYLEVKKAVCHEIKYHLQRESAKIVPHLVLAMVAIGGKSEIYDLFPDNRFDGIFRHFVPSFERKNLRDEEPEDELERRLRKLNPKVGEYASQVTICGGVGDSSATIVLKPDTEFAAYLVAGIDNYRRGRLILQNFTNADISDTPLGQLRRMGVEFLPHNEDGVRGLLVRKSAVKGRRVAYEQLHDYPDAVGALALAAAIGEGTSVIHSSPYNTPREEARRRRLSEIIRSFGAKIAEIDDGLVVEGRKELTASTVSAEADSLCSLLVAAATLGVVDRIEVDELSLASSRWGESFEKLRQLLSPAVTESTA